MGASPVKSIQNYGGLPALSDVLFKDITTSIFLTPQTSTFLCEVRDNHGCESLSPQLKKKIQAVSKNIENELSLTKVEASELANSLSSFTGTTPKMISAEFPGSLCAVLENLF